MTQLMQKINQTAKAIRVNNEYVEFQQFLIKKSMKIVKIILKCD